MLDRKLTKIQGGHSDSKAVPWVGSMMREETAEEMGSKTVFCGCICCYCCLFVCLVLILALTIFIDLAKLMELLLSQLYC